jgi:predicted metal-dependent peptidase
MSKTTTSSETKSLPDTMIPLEEAIKTWDPSTFTIDTLEQRIRDLFIFKPFFGYTLGKIDRKLDITLPAPAALTIESLEIIINPVLFSQFTEPEQIAVLEHEVLHFAFKHPQRFRNFYASVMANRDQNLAMRLNVAMDAAINQLIPNIPEGCVTLDSIRDIVDYIYKHKPEAYNGKKPIVEEKKSSEYYFNLINHTVEDPDIPGGGGSGDSEGEGSEAGEGGNTGDPSDMDTHKHLFGAQNNEMNRKEIDRIIEGAKEHQRAHDRKAGVGAGQSILDLLPEDVPVVHDKIWRKLVEKNFGETPNPQKEQRWGRPSRRKEGSNYYDKRVLISNVVYVGLDTSASVSNKEIAEYLGYINRAMKKYGTEVILIQCDTQVDSVKKLRRISKRDVGFSITGRGGTDLTKILDHIEENDKDPNNARLILLTDGYTPWRKSKVTTSVVYTEHHALIDGVDNYAVMHASGVFDGE